MANRQNDDLFSVVAIQGDVRALPELNHPFAKLSRQLLDWTANLRMFTQRLYALAFGSQKLVEAGYIPMSLSFRKAGARSLWWGGPLVRAGRPRPALSS